MVIIIYLNLINNNILFYSVSSWSQIYSQKNKKSKKFMQKEEVEEDLLSRKEGLLADIFWRLQALGQVCRDICLESV